MVNELILKEEKLDLAKSWVKRGEAKIYKDIYEKHLTITIPLQFEDLVVEKVVDGNHETIRIPISEERVEHVIEKHILNDIKVYQNYFEDTCEVKVDLKKESAVIDEHIY